MPCNIGGIQPTFRMNLLPPSSSVQVNNI